MTAHRNFLVRIELFQIAINSVSGYLTYLALFCLVMLLWFYITSPQAVPVAQRVKTIVFCGFGALLWMFGYWLIQGVFRGNGAWDLPNFCGAFMLAGETLVFYAAVSIFRVKASTKRSNSSGVQSPILRGKRSSDPTVWPPAPTDRKH